MGATIRREPVNFRIPASPNYKFFNITDFRGLEMTDNPFITNSNTASDLLNVYVDENNALTTRPRLEKQYEISKKINKFNKVLYSYKLMDKTIFQVLINSTVVKLYYKQGDNFKLIDNDTNNIALPETKLAIFEKKDKIYVMTGTLYCVIKPDNIMYTVKDDVDTYVPTIGYSTVNDKGSRVLVEHEQKNILSNKYRIDYFWDLESDIRSDFYEHGEIVRNDYLKQYKSDKIPDVGLYQQLGFMLSNNNMLLLKDNFFSVATVKNSKIITEDFIDLGAFPSAYSSNGKWFVIKDGDNLGFSVKGYDDGVLIRDYHINTNFWHNDSKLEIAEITISDDGKQIFLIARTPKQGDDSLTEYWSLNGYVYDTTSDSYKEQGIFGYDNSKADVDYKFHPSFTRIYFSKDFSKVILVDMEKLMLLSDFNPPNTRSEIYFLKALSFNNISFSDDLSVVGVFDRNLPRVYLGKIKTSLSDIDMVVKDVPEKIERVSVNNKGELYAVSRNSVYKISTTSDLYKTVDLKTITEEPSHETQLEHATETTVVGVSDDGKTIWRVQKNLLTESVFVVEQYAIIYADNLQKSSEFLLTVEYTNNNDTDKPEQTFDYNGMLRFQNNFWFYGNGNEIRWTGNNDPTYFPEHNYTNLGDTNDVVNDMLLVSYDTAIAFKQNNMYVINPLELNDGTYTYTFVEAKSDVGVIAPQSSIISPLTETPLYVSDKGIYGLQQLKNIQSTDRISVLYSENVNKKYLKEDKKNHIQSISRLYWALFVVPDKISKVYVFDDRTASWYYWELPINVVGCWSDELNSYFVSDEGKVYIMKTNDIIDIKYSQETEYYDDGRKLIPWYWKSQILSLGTINYSKKLINTTFILTDTDENEEYGLNYKFKAYRKIVSETNATTITNRLNYIQSTTKKTTIPRFNFLQLEVSNIEEDLNNNKLRLVGLGLKYELLEGLI